MLWIISIMGLLVALGALFYSGTTLSKLNVFTETLTKGYKAEVQGLKESLETKIGILDQRADDLEKNLSPLNQSHTNFTAEIAALRKQIIKMQGQLDKLG